MAAENHTVEKYREALQEVDRISQWNFDSVAALAVAIQKMTKDETIRQLAKQIHYHATDGMNEINVAAEELGANYKEERSHG
jgi:thiaminase